MTHSCCFEGLAPAHSSDRTRGPQPNAAAAATSSEDFSSNVARRPFSISVSIPRKIRCDSMPFSDFQAVKKVSIA
jgi:hypothetical protein